MSEKVSSHTKVSAALATSVTRPSPSGRHATLRVGVSPSRRGRTLHLPRIAASSWHHTRTRREETGKTYSPRRGRSLRCLNAPAAFCF